MKTEEEIKEAAEKWYGNTPGERSKNIFIHCAKWMQEQVSWIDPNVTPPEIGKKYAFIVDSPNDYYNGEVFGGKYQGNRYGYHEFSLPGISFAGTLYQPLPNPPKEKLK